MKREISNREQWKISFKINLPIYLTFIVIFIFFSIGSFGIALFLVFIPSTVFFISSLIGLKLTFSKNKYYKKSIFFLVFLSFLTISGVSFLMEFRGLEREYHIFGILGFYYLICTLVGLLLTLILYWYINKRYVYEKFK